LRAGACIPPPGEKDEENARYWYRQAGVPAETGALEAEWAAIARYLLAKSR
jgi:hypothetical protein